MRGCISKIVRSRCDEYKLGGGDRNHFIDGRVREVLQSLRYLQATSARACSERAIEVLPMDLGRLLCDAMQASDLCSVREWKFKSPRDVFDQCRRVDFGNVAIAYSLDGMPPSSIAAAALDFSR